MWGERLLDFAQTGSNAFLLAFPSLFSIINPVGGAFIFDSVLRGVDLGERNVVAGRIGLYALLIMFGALWIGAYVLNFFGVTLDALRIAGGLVVTASGWGLLSGGDERSDRKDAERTSRPSAGDPLQMAFFPLTLPFTTGPGTIAVAITLGAGRPPVGHGLLAFFVGVSLAATANAAAIWIAYRSAARQVVVRLSAFLLMCVGVQILVSAVGGVIMSWRGA